MRASPAPRAAAIARAAGPSVGRRTFLDALAIGALDVIAATAVVGGDYLYSYRMRRALGGPTASTAQGGGSAIRTASFAGRFSAVPVSTATTYRDAGVSVELTRFSGDSGKVDPSARGAHLKYGSKVSYVLADVCVSDVTCLRSVFASDVYGVGYAEQVRDMAARTGAIAGVNGDSYSNNRHRDNGTIIRNGKVYRSAPSTEETCVLFRDGRMAVYAPGQVDARRLAADGAWQSWVFGPSLLDAGKAKTSFLTWDYIRESHPRTAIGYYEPGHYCLLAVDGRQRGSRGLFLDEMAVLFEKLGCRVAYNLDGGSSTFMTFGSQVVNSPYSPSHAVSDGFFVYPSASSGSGRGISAKGGGRI